MGNQGHSFLGQRAGLRWIAILYLRRYLSCASLWMAPFSCQLRHGVHVIDAICSRLSPLGRVHVWSRILHIIPICR